MSCMRRFLVRGHFIKRIGLALTLFYIIMGVALWFQPELSGGGNETDYFVNEPLAAEKVPTSKDLLVSKTEQVQTTSLSVEERLRKRANFTQIQCDKKWSKKLGAYLKSWLHFDEPTTMVMCIVAKAGCTFWGRIYSFLTRPEMMKSLNVHSPFEIDRVLFHHKSGVRGKVVSGNKTNVLMDHENVLRFFFRRDPYKRLWATFLDKYYLPGYWGKHPLMDPSNGICQIGVTFQTFLEYAVTSDDPHVIPISLGCNPCVFKPQVIGEMDTFFSDSEYILDVKKYSYLLTNYTNKSFIEREIKTIASYNFVTRLNYQECLDIRTLARLLWSVFQFNGYIRFSRQFPKRWSDYSEQGLIQMFINQSNTDPLSKLEAKRQKRQLLVTAYRSVSRDVIQSIQGRFQADFELFDYDKNPPS